MKRLFLTTSLLATSIAHSALAETQVACTILGCERVEIEPPKFGASNSFSVQEVWTVVNDILSVSGLAPNFQVLETQEIGNAAAVIFEDERYLAFNPVWMTRYKDDPSAKWHLYGVMAHEVGHHLQGHTIGSTGSRPPTELEADEYAGFTLAALGASLEEAQSLWATLDLLGSPTHPPRDQRLQAVQRGWQRYTARRPGTQPTQVAQPDPNSAPATTAKPQRLNLPAPQRPGERCNQEWSDFGSFTLCASSVLASQSGNSYGAGNVLDGNPSTAWVEGVAGSGRGEYLTFRFDEPTTVQQIYITNGYTKSSKSFWNNARVAQLRLTASNGANQTVYLDDHADWQGITTDALKNVSWLQLRVADTYRGAKWEDTAISEIRFVTTD